jgi:hypothetical protein
MPNGIRWFCLLVPIIAALLVTPIAAAAQDANASPVFVAVPDVFPDLEARALIVREPGRDIVVLDPEEATTEALAMALFLLGNLRERNPDPSGGELIPITGFAMTRPPSGGHLRRIAGTLKRLEVAPTAPVGNLGPGRWVRLLGR